MLPFIDIHNHHNIENNNNTVSIYSFFAQYYQKAINQTNGYYTIGLHPWHTNDVDINNALIKIEQIAILPNCIGIGEIGIDHASTASINKQLIAFEQQLLIAKKLQLPVIIHNVRSLTEILQIIKKIKFEYPVVFHGFTGKTEMAQQITNTRAYLSFGESLAHHNTAIKSVPSNNFFFETDESEYTIQDIYNMASYKLNTPIESLKQIVYNNFTTVFTKYHA